MSKASDTQKGRPALRPGQRARLAARRVPRLQIEAAIRKAQAHEPRPPYSIRASWPFIAVVELVALALLAIMARGQFEIAWVMLSSRPAQATVMTVTCSRGYRHTSSDVTLAFVDSVGSAHIVVHANDTLDCFDTYHAGERIPIRYSSLLPTALLTQAELDELPSVLLAYALVDLMVLGLPVVVLRYPRALTAFLRRLPGRKAATRTRYGRNAGE